MHVYLRIEHRYPDIDLGEEGGIELIVVQKVSLKENRKDLSHLCTGKAILEQIKLF